MTAFTVENLIRHLERLQARGPIPFDVKSGEIFGILCPCGQDRQTLLSLLMTILFPIPGFAERSPLAVLGNLGDVRRSMGIVLPESVLDPALTGRENLDFHARLHGLGDDLRKKRVPEVIDFFGIAGSADARVETYSPVTLQQLEIARAYLTRPSVLFLAEPTAGLDDAGRREIWGLLRRLNRERRATIIFTTHDVEEAEATCTRVAVVDRGEVVALDTPETFRAVMTLDDTPIKFDNPT
ncbi:Daunorubicin/doxorubicin resistance ATP-binding protein DrrA [Methanoculleus chikugoensis]|jgi:ABC-2 type transport system ATP-binding protein|uniref:Daunorubicin/doxorubicin resistance ATP-binding protein DrrA n=1 Tax=Methanoculleus chikugoensis TaxID=118126 RepID=A0A1M4MHY9_9EURY|nr:ATP-binding cassette domain-containing protein [Methanoculleus chikugoensis]NMA10666.1 ATP-binding cassette domain-containing protein [Methanomicrobiales archaeon]SCL74524.1 Daunorubicin/doxorubicin resistance ATP-binding protein DrrA [Methanoculleus chikugoensis]